MSEPTMKEFDEILELAQTILREIPVDTIDQHFHIHRSLSNLRLAVHLMRDRRRSDAV